MPSFRDRNTRRARALRTETSPAERQLWSYLSRDQLNGCHFTRQFQIGPYFVDFVCRKYRLAIEIDGFSHDMTQDRDARRTQLIEASGYCVIRFTNEDVLRNTDGVVRQIVQKLGALAVIAPEPSPSPSRKREGD